MVKAMGLMLLSLEAIMMGRMAVECGK